MKQENKVIRSTCMIVIVGISFSMPAYSQQRVRMRRAAGQFRPASRPSPSRKPRVIPQAKKTLRPQVSRAQAQLPSNVSINSGVSEEKISYFYELSNWIQANKFCLTGTGCPLWVSFAAHYLLGTAISIGMKIIVGKAGGLYWRAIEQLGIVKPESAAYQEQGDIKKGLSQVARMVHYNALVAPLVAMSRLAVKLGYKKILSVQTSSMLINPFRMLVGKKGFPEAMRCLWLGQGCDVNQRRRAFFEAGLLTGSTVHKLAKFILTRILKQIVPFYGVDLSF